jgi:hypothetical protein
VHPPVRYIAGLGSDGRKGDPLNPGSKILLSLAGLELNARQAGIWVGTISASSQEQVGNFAALRRAGNEAGGLQSFTRPHEETFFAFSFSGALHLDVLSKRRIRSTLQTGRLIALERRNCEGIANTGRFNEQSKHPRIPAGKQ